MSVDRCPSCAAAVPAEAPWCTLCWTSLRQPEPEPVPVTVPATMPATLSADVEAPPTADVPAQPTELDPLTAPLPAEPTPTTTLATRPIGWPCVACNISVPIDDDECPNCGRRFLSAALGEDEGLVDRLPGMTEKKGFTAAVIVTGSFGLTIVLVLLLAILGLIF